MTAPIGRAKIRLLEFDAPEHARSYLDALRTQRTADDALVASLSGQEIEVVWTPLTGVAGDLVVGRTLRIAGAGGTFTERHSAWVVRGATVVVVSADGFRPGLRLGWTVDAVYARLDARARACRFRSTILNEIPGIVFHGRVHPERWRTHGLSDFRICADVFCVGRRRRRHR